jgi:hypothetical protein
MDGVPEQARYSSGGVPLAGSRFESVRLAFAWATHGSRFQECQIASIQFGEEEDQATTSEKLVALGCTTAVAAVVC